MNVPIDSSGILRVAAQRAVKSGIAAGLVVYFTYHLTHFDPARNWLRVPAVDTSIIFDRTREIFARADYPARLRIGNTAALFPYPPPAVLLFRGLGICGLRTFIAAWIILMVTGLLVTFRASLAGENDEVRCAWLALGAASLLFADSPVSWDLRAGNSNLVYLSLVLAGYGLLQRRPWLAGALVGLSISLKLYSGLLLVWLLVNGPRRPLYAAAIATVVLWLLLPMALFGLDGTIRLYAGWREQLRIINGLWVYRVIDTGYGPPLITLRRAVIGLTGGGPDAATTRSLLLLLWAVWLAALLWYSGRALSGGRVVAPSRAALADWTILLLAPLPFSPWIEPYHAVAVVPGTILCLVIALDRHVENQARVIAAVGALSVFLTIHLIGVSFQIRGLGLLAQFLCLLIVFGLLRPRLARLPSSMYERDVVPGS